MKMIRYNDCINTSSKYFIYRLCEPETMVPRYVGITNNAGLRYAKHLKEKSITLKNNWIKSLIKKGKNPVMLIIDSADTRVEANKLERYWILKHKDWGFDLKNMTDGGDGGDTMTGRKLTKEQSEKISKSKIGKPNPAASLSNKIHKSKPVNQIDPISKTIINTFPSVAEASRITGCSKTNIGKMASGKIKSTIKLVGGYEWNYN